MILAIIVGSVVGAVGAAALDALLRGHDASSRSVVVAGIAIARGKA